MVVGVCFFYLPFVIGSVVMLAVKCALAVWGSPDWYAEMQVMVVTSLLLGVPLTFWVAMEALKKSRLGDRSVQRNVVKVVFGFFVLMAVLGGISQILG